MTAARPIAVLLASLSVVVAGSLRAQGPDVGTQAQRDSGKQLYEQYCSQCHGEKGDGEGYAAAHLMPRPRNFTTGKFKVRTTPNGALPTHQDLVNIIKRGMPYTSMPAWPTLSDQQVSDLAHFITTFSPDFSSPENVPKPVSFPSAPSATKESAELGKKLYEETGCVRCHGSLGRGDGPSAPTLKDDWGFPIRAANLSQRWTFRGGSSREDIFKTMSTGFNGTPMPSFADSLTPEQRWAITDFIVSLSAHGEPGYSNLVIAKHVADRIDPANGTASFAAAAATRLPVVGQIMEPGRSFHPPATNVTVQAVYDAESIAFLVRWDDMSAEKAGKNSPALPVPVEEEEAAPATAAQPSEKDPFADTTAAPAAEASEFSDAVAIQLPAEVPAGAHKPYFIFGDAQHAVDLLFFDLAGSAPAQFTGKGSGAITPKEASDLAGAASYDQGQWSVIFKRPLRPAAGAAFTPGEFMPIAFSVWDGYSRERGNRRGLTLWNSVYMEPETVPSAVGPMIRTALAILAIELAVIAWARWHHGKQGRGEIRGQQPVTSG